MNNLGYGRRIQNSSGHGRRRQQQLHTVTCMDSVGLTTGEPYLLDNKWLNNCHLFTQVIMDTLNGVTPCDPCFAAGLVVGQDPRGIEFFTISYNKDDDLLYFHDCANTVIESGDPLIYGVPQSVIDYLDTSPHIGGFPNWLYVRKADGDQGVMGYIQDVDRTFVFECMEAGGQIVFNELSGIYHNVQPVPNTDMYVLEHQGDGNYYLIDDIQSTPRLLATFSDIYGQVDINHLPFTYVLEYSYSISRGLVDQSDTTQYSGFIVYKLTYGDPATKEVVGFIDGIYSPAIVVTYSDSQILFTTSYFSQDYFLYTVPNQPDFGSTVEVDLMQQVDGFIDLGVGSANVLICAHNQITLKNELYITQNNNVELGLTDVEFFSLTNIYNYPSEQEYYQAIQDSGARKYMYKFTATDSDLVSFQLEGSVDTLACGGQQVSV